MKRILARRRQVIALPLILSGLMSWCALPVFRVKADPSYLTCESLSVSALSELSNTKPDEATRVRVMKAYGQMRLPRGYLCNKPKSPV